MTSKVLSFIGKIGTPTGLAAVFCAIVGLNNIETAIISLVTMAITATFLLYHPISNALPSPFVLILLIILSTIFFFSYESILLKKTGLTKYWKLSSKIIGVIPEKIEKASNEIWFCGTNFHITAVDDRILIINKLKQGVNVNYLIFNPNSKNAEVAAKSFNQSVDEFKGECLQGLKSLMVIKREWEKLRTSVNKPGELRIRYHDEIPKLRAYIFDPNNSDSESFYILYMYLTNSPELPGFQFKNYTDGVFMDYFACIKKLWQKSIDINQLDDNN